MPDENGRAVTIRELSDKLDAYRARQDLKIVIALIAGQVLARVPFTADMARATLATIGGAL